MRNPSKRETIFGDMLFFFIHYTYSLFWMKVKINVFCFFFKYLRISVKVVTQRIQEKAASKSKGTMPFGS